MEKSQSHLRLRSLVIPLAVVGGWILLIVGLSTSLGSWSHSQILIQRLLGTLSPNWAAHLSPQTWEQINFILRKCAHFSEYAVLFSLVYWLCRRRLKVRRAIALPLVLGCIILFAISDEFHQSFVPGRTPHPRDVLIDSCGAATVALIALKLDRPEDTIPSSISPKSP